MSETDKILRELKLVAPGDEFTVKGEATDTGKGGRKNDAGKNMVSLVDPIFILELGKVLTHGAKKYAIDNWKKFDPENNPLDKERLLSALLRHFYKAKLGEVYDKDSGEDRLNHWAQVGFYAMVMTYFTSKNQYLVQDVLEKLQDIEG